MTASHGQDDKFNDFFAHVLEYQAGHRTGRRTALPATAQAFHTNRERLPASLARDTSHQGIADARGRRDSLASLP